LTVWGFWRGTDGQQQPLLSAYAYETAAEMYPDDLNTVLWLFTAGQYEEAHIPEKAQEWYEKVLTVEPDNEDAQEALAALG
jgi:predicted TPR repeat methyltransferase